MIVCTYDFAMVNEIISINRVKLLCCMLGSSPLRPAVAALNWTSSGGLGRSSRCSQVLCSPRRDGQLFPGPMHCCLFGLPLTLEEVLE